MRFTLEVGRDNLVRVRDNQRGKCVTSKLTVREQRGEEWVKVPNRHRVIMTFNNDSKGNREAQGIADVMNTRLATTPIPEWMREVDVFADYPIM